MLTAHFDMKDLGETSFDLGIETHYDRFCGILGLSQKGYIKKNLNRFNMKSCKPCTTIIQKGERLSSTQCPQIDNEATEMEKVPCASIVDSLMYAQICTRPILPLLLVCLGNT